MPRATLESRFPEVIAELRPKVGASIKASAELVEERAKAKVPVGPDPVHLFDAIHVERESVGEYSVVAGGPVPGDEDVYYGHMVEFGTSHSAPEPFLVPALEESRPEIEALVTGALRGL